MSVRSGEFKKVVPEAILPTLARGLSRAQEYFPQVYNFTPMGEVVIPAGSEKVVDSGIEVTVPEGQLGFLYVNAQLLSELGLQSKTFPIAILEEGTPLTRVKLTVANTKKEPITIPAKSPFMRLALSPLTCTRQIFQTASKQPQAEVGK